MSAPDSVPAHTAIMDAIHESDTGLCVPEIAERVGLPIPKVTHLVRRLQAAGMIWDSGARRDLDAPAVYYINSSVDRSVLPSPAVADPREKRRKAKQRQSNAAGRAAEKAADAALRDAVVAVVKRVADARATFAAYDIGTELEKMNSDPVTPSLVSASIARAMTLGYCEKGERVHTRRQGREVQMYRSRLFPPGQSMLEAPPSEVEPKTVGGDGARADVRRQARGGRSRRRIGRPCHFSQATRGGGRRRAA